METGRSAQATGCGFPVLHSRNLLTRLSASTPRCMGGGLIPTDAMWRNICQSSQICLLNMSTLRGKPRLRFANKIWVEPHLTFYNFRFRRRQSASSARIIHRQWSTIKQRCKGTAATWRTFKSFCWRGATWNQSTSSHPIPLRSRSSSTWNRGKTEGINTSVQHICIYFYFIKRPSQWFILLFKYHSLIWWKYLCLYVSKTRHAFENLQKLVRNAKRYILFG